MLREPLSGVALPLQRFCDCALGARERQIHRRIEVCLTSIGDQNAEGAGQLDATTLVDAAAGTVGVFEADSDGSNLFLEAMEGKSKAGLDMLGEGLGLGQAFPTDIDVHAGLTHEPWYRFPVSRRWVRRPGERRSVPLLLLAMSGRVYDFLVGLSASSPDQTNTVSPWPPRRLPVES